MAICIFTLLTPTRVLSTFKSACINRDTSTRPFNTPKRRGSFLLRPAENIDLVTFD